MRGFRNQLRLVLTAVALSGLSGIVMLSGQQVPAAGAYTAAQAAAGRTAYQAQCSSCHQPDLRGQGDAAPLAGAEFMGAWGRRSPRELFTFMQLTMPPTRPGGLSQDEYVNVVAFILQSNGAPAGNQPPGDNDGGDGPRDRCGGDRPGGSGAGTGPRSRGARGGWRRARARSGTACWHHGRGRSQKLRLRSPTRCCAIRIRTTG